MDLEFQDVTHFFIFLWFLFYYATHFLQCHQYTVICRHLEIPVRIHYAVLFLFLSNYHQQILPSFQEVKFILQQVVREISFYMLSFYDWKWKSKPLPKYQTQFLCIILSNFLEMCSIQFLLNLINPVISSFLNISLYKCKFKGTAVLLTFTWDPFQLYNNINGCVNLWTMVLTYATIMFLIRLR